MQSWSLVSPWMMPRCARDPTDAAQHPWAGADGCPSWGLCPRCPQCAPHRLCIGLAFILLLLLFVLFVSLDYSVRSPAPLTPSLPLGRAGARVEGGGSLAGAACPVQGAGDGSPTGGRRVLLPSPVPWALGVAPSPRGQNGA